MYNCVIQSQKKFQRDIRKTLLSDIIMENNVDENNPKNQFFYNKEGVVVMENMNHYEEYHIDYKDIWSKLSWYFFDNLGIVFNRKNKYLFKILNGIIKSSLRVNTFKIKIHGLKYKPWIKYSKKV